MVLDKTIDGPGTGPPHRGRQLAVRPPGRETLLYMAQKVKPLCGDLHAITLQFEAAAATGGTAQLAFIDHEERVLADGPAAPAALPQVGGKAQGPGQTQAEIQGQEHWRGLFRLQYRAQILHQQEGFRRGVLPYAHGFHKAQAVGRQPHALPVASQQARPL